MTTKSKDWLIYNAVLAWLHNYPNNQLTKQYEDLKDELTNPSTVRKRGRKATRQRKKETASPATSTEACEISQT